MDDFVNEKFINIILQEYPDIEANLLFQDEQFEDGIMFNAVTIAQFPGIRIDLLIIRGENDSR
tara:strand:- start:248 stop:436 length:189 start_codon:yes stop_codon:yes gene_type:complete